MADGHIEIEVDLNSDKAEKELDKFTKTIDTGTKQAAKSSENATKQFAKSTESTAKRAEKTVEQSTKQAGKAVETSAKQAGEKASQSTKRSSEEQKKSYKQTEEQAKASAENASKYWESAGNKIKNVANVAAKAAGAALVAGGTAAITSSISFESAFVGVKKTVNATNEELSAMRTNIIGMSKEMPTSANEIAGVAEAAGQLGIKTKNIAGFSKTMVMLGDSTNMSADTAATSLARLANITGMPQTQFDRLGSTIVALGNNLATTESEITDMAMRIAGAGSQVGMSEAEIMSFSGALSSVGIEAEAGGTAFSTLLSKMNLATTKGGDSLNNFAKVAGMSSAQFKKAFQEDAAGATIQFIQGLDKVNKSGGSAIKVLDDMGLSDVRMRDALLRAAGASDTFTNALKIGNTAWDENKALTNEANQRYKTLESRIGILKNKATALGIAVGDELKGPLADGVTAASNAIGKLTKQVETHGIQSIVPKETITTIKNLGTVAKTVAGGGIKVLGASAKVLGSNMSTVLPVAASLLTVFKGYTAAKAAATGVKTLTTAYKALDTVEKANAITLVAQSGGLTALQTVVGVFTGKVSLATAATGAFNAACTALGGPVGVAVLAIGALTAGAVAYRMTLPKTVTESEKFAESCKKLSEKQDKLSASIKSLHKENESNVDAARAQGVQAEQLAGQLERLMKVENKSAGTKARIKSVVKQLNEIMPDLKLSYDAETDSLNKSTSAIKKNIDALKEQAMAKAYQSGMEKTAKKVAEAEIANEDAIKKQTKAQEKYNKAKAEYDSLVSKAEKGEISWNSDKLDEAQEKVTDYAASLKDANDTVEKSRKDLKTVQSDLDAYTDKFTAQQNYATYLNQLDELAKEAGIKASKIPKSVGQGIKDGVYANPTTGDELKQLIKLDDLLNGDELAKMQEAGMKIPEYLSKGIADGSISFKDAAKQLENGADWTGMIEKAKEKGRDVPNSIAEGIQSGQYAVPTSVAAVENLVTFEDLKTKAQNGGIQVPEYLANGITSGSMKPAEATKALSNLMNFQDAIDKAGLQGAQVPTELATKIAQGKVSVDDAITQLMSGQGLSVENFGLKTVVDNAIKSTGDSTKQLENKLKINPVDNSGAASSTFEPFKTESSKTANNVKKNTDSIKKSSKIPATDNSGSGTKTESSYTSALGKGAGKAKSATASISKSAVSGFNTGTNAAKSAGVKVGTTFASGISSMAGEAKTAGGKAAKAGSSGANGGKSGFVAAGKNLSSGIASGIDANSGIVEKAARRVVRNAKDAANAEADSHSPSRVFRDEVGKFLPLGMAVGIRKNTGEVEDASRKMAAASLGATADELEIHSPSRKFRDIIGKNIPKGIAKGVREAQSELTAEMKTVVSSALSAAKNATKTGDYSGIGSDLVSGLSDSLNLSKSRSSETIQEIINQQYNSLVSANEKAEQKMQNKIDKTKNKKKKSRLKKELKNLKSANGKKEKQLKQAGEKTANAYNTAFEKEAERLTSIAEEKIQKLSETYQTKYNEIKSLMDSLVEKQQSWGNIYDLDQNIMDLERYQADLKSLENKIPESLMEKILGMNIDESTAYMDWFQSMSDAEQKAYIEKWNKQQEMSKSFSENFFSDDFEKINKEYQTELKKATDNLEKQMKQAGANIANGLTAGMKSETRNMSKSMKKICDDLIKAAKKELKIKSPSRKFAEIGKYNIQGAEKGHEKEAKNLYQQMENVSQTMAERFAKAKLDVPNIQSRMQSAVASQMARVTANMQPQVVYANSGGGTTVEKTVYTGPEKIEIPVILEGKEVARVTAPYMDQRLNMIADRKLRGGT